MHVGVLGENTIWNGPPVPQLWEPCPVSLVEILSPISYLYNLMFANGSVPLSRFQSHSRTDFISMSAPKPRQKSTQYVVSSSSGKHYKDLKRKQSSATSKSSTQDDLAKKKRKTEELYDGILFTGTY